MSFSLKPLSEKRRKQKEPIWGVYDIEGSDWINHVVSGSYWEGWSDELGTFDEYDTNLNFHKSVDDFLKYLFSDDCKMTEVWCHFGGIYDFLFILDRVFNGRGYEVIEMLPRGSALLNFKITNKKKTITFRDSCAILPFGLDTITESFKVKHEKLKMDRTKITKDTPEVRKYLKNDCVGLYESIKKFKEWSPIKECGFKTTIASQSIQILKKYLPCEIPSLSKETDKFIRKGYFGGRTEIYKPVFMGDGKNKLHYYDINSLYPYCMKNLSVPIEYKGISDKIDLGKTIGFFECTVRVPDCYSPPLPWVHPESKKLLFPTGTLRGIWSTLELEYAVGLGCEIEKVHIGREFARTASIFKDFIDEMYRIRLKAKQEMNSVDDIMAKLVMNSCYGRFGLNRIREQLTLGHDNETKISKPAFSFEHEDGYTIVIDKYEKELKSFSHVGIAAWITSGARILNHKKQQELDFNVYYTDTDSFFTPTKVKEGGDLGELKLEYDLDRACFLLPKTYILESGDDIFKSFLQNGDKVRSTKKIAMKGFDKYAVQRFSMSDFLSAIEGDFRKLKVPTPRKMARMRTAWNKGEVLTMLDESTKQIRSHYEKRRIFKTRSGGYDTEPLVIENGMIKNDEPVILKRNSRIEDLDYGLEEGINNV